MINNETLIADKKYFITNTSNPSIFDWMLSKGTNYTCYVEVMSKLSDDDIYNRRIDKVRILVTTIQTPLQFYFFYWSLLVFVLHKFNFKKPVMKIILGHLLIRCTGNILEQFGEFYKYYYVSEKDGDVYKCKYENNVHPFRWFLTRQIGTIFWYVGEIIADWYPLLRTKAVVKNKSLIYIYITCAIFNLSKIALIILHLLKSPSKLYNIDDGTYNDKDMNFFYLVYWTIQLTIIYTSVLYEFSVYIVLKNNIFKVTQYDFGFLKKFKTLSEYRILVSAFVSLIFLPVISVTFILKFIFYYYKHNLNFDFEVVRQAIANVQYYMIFIDQILLFYSSYESKLAAFEFYSDRGNNKSNGDILNTSFNFNSNNEKKSKFKQRRNTINIISSSNNKLSSTSDYNNHNNHNNNINNINNINNFNNNIHTKHYSFENSVEADTSMSYIDNNINNINNTDNINNNNNNNNINNNNNNNTNNNYNNNYNNKDHHYHRTRNSVMFIEN